MKKENSIDQLIKKIRSDLLSISRKTKRTNESVVIQYMSEWLLYRLSKSQYSGKFILKGGLLLFTKTEMSGRPTRDIDLLAVDISNDMSELKKIFTGIFKIDFRMYDGLRYDIESLSIERIREGAQYEGVRISIWCFLGEMTQKVQIDVGIGDVVVPDPVAVEFPTLLEMDPPVIRIYSMESVIAEKFEAMLSLGTANSRMKDFYDVFELCKKLKFEGATLQEAISETLKRRKIQLNAQPVIFTEKFAWEQTKIQQWVAFLARTGLQSEKMFYIVMETITKFLGPVYEAIMDNKEFKKQWSFKKGTWE